jgi:predicted NBD/HSP70 family sugar kinase
MQKNERYQIQILNFLNEKGRADTQMLTALLGVSESSLSRVMKDMVAKQLVAVSETESGGPGRPAQIFRLRPSLTYAIGVELTTQVMRWTLINTAGDVLKHGEYPIDLPTTNEEFLERFERAVSIALTKADVPQNRIFCIGVAIHGFIDHQNVSCIYCTAIPGPQNIPVGTRLEDRFGLPAIILEDGRSLAVAESRFGSRRDLPNFIAVTIGNNSIGTGIIIDHQLYLGETSMAGHLAHISVDSTGPTCVCGARGCVEVIATAQAIIDDVLASLERHTITSIVLGDQPLDLETIAQAAEQGDKLCYQALNRVGEMTGIGIGTLTKVLNINRVVMYGTMPRVSTVYMDAIRRSVRLNTLPLVEPIIDVSSLPTYTISQGAAYYALNKQLAQRAEEFVKATS